MSYTNADIANAIAYSNQRIILRTMNSLYATHPHIVSHLQYSIKLADPDVDYYYPTSFAKKAILITTVIPEIMCDKISCNNTRQWDLCTPKHEASYYRVGVEVDEIERQCQPACYHLMMDPAIDEETGNLQVQMMRLTYRKDYGCIILPPALSWQEFPFYRSNERFEQRKNDLPAGFDRAPDIPFTYSGRSYRYNKPYCDAYFDQWSESKKTCIVTWYEKIGYAVIGESIIKLAKAGIQALENGNASTYPPLPPLPDVPTIENEWLLSGWKQDVNADFILPPLDFSFTDEFIEQRETCYPKVCVLENTLDKKKRLIQKLKKQQTHLATTIRRKLEANFTIEILNDAEKARIHFVRDYTNGSRSTCDFTKIHADDDGGFNIVDVISSIFGSMMDPSFWLDMGIGFVSDVALDQIKKTARKLADKLIPKLVDIILATTTKLLSEVLSKSIMATIAQCTARIIIKSTGKVMVKMAELMAEMASIIGWILVIITLFDLILSIWDPLGFNNKFDEAIIDSVMQQSDVSLRMALATPVPVIDFNILASIILSDDVILDNSLHVFSDIYEYLDALTVNVEGSRIYKGFEVDPSKIEHNPADESIAKSKIDNFKDFFVYETDHAIRMRFFDNSNFLVLFLFSIAISMLLLNIYLLAILFLFIALLIVFLSYLNSANLDVGLYAEQSFAFFSMLNNNLLTRKK